MTGASPGGNPRHALGARAEARVAGWLAERGWTVLGHRVRLGGGELDIVAIDPGGTLVGIEVRARRSERTGSALESLDRAAIARRRRALAAYASAAPAHHDLRLDLVALSPASHDRWRLTHISGVEAR